jgi:hypothetical protein
MLNLDLSNVSESGLPPDGEYLMVVDEAVVKESKAGGQYINARWKFLDGPSIGSTFYAMYNIKVVPKDSSQEAAQKAAKAQSIGQGDLKKVLKAGGRDPNRLSSASDLEGITVSAKIKISTDDYGEKVRIVKYNAAAVAKDAPF